MSSKLCQQLLSADFGELTLEAIDGKDTRIPTGEDFNIADCVFNN